MNSLSKMDFFYGEGTKNNILYLPQNFLEVQGTF